MTRALLLTLLAASLFLSAFTFANDPTNEMPASKTSSCCDEGACCRK